MLEQLPRKILVHLDTDQHPGVYLRIVALDSGADEVLAYGGLTTAMVPDLVQGVLFSRRADALHRSAIAISGADVGLAEELLTTVLATFIGPLRVSLLLDPRGANTTAAAAVVQLDQDNAVRGRRALILGGTGPVGIRLAGLLARAGAEVIIASRRRERARAAAARVQARLGLEIGSVETRDEDSIRRHLPGVQILLNAVAPGVMMLQRSSWVGAPELTTLVDVNAVPPPGLEGVSPADAGERRDGRRVYGALAIARLKTTIQRRCVAHLFERHDLVFDAEEIYDLARTLLLEDHPPVPSGRPL